MRKPLLSAALLLLTCANVPAQTEAGAAAPAHDGVKTEAARLLESQSSGERAWGAYLAGRNGLKEAEPALVGLLSDPSLGDGDEAKFARQAALDALIRLGARVPAELLRALPAEFADEAIILMAVSPEENAAALLEAFDGMAGDAGQGARWLAVGNLLAETKARGFAPLLLRDLKVEAEVVLVDAEGEGGIGHNGGGGCGHGGIDYVRRVGFPPVEFYRLTNEAERGAVVFVEGRRPVFYVSSTSPYDSGCPARFDRDIVRVEYLASLLDTSEYELGFFDARPSESVVCKEARQCLRELAGVRGRIRRAYAKMVGRLVEKGHLDGAGDAPPSPPLTFTLYDERRRRTFPPPDRLKGVTVLVEDMQPAEASGAEAP